MPLTEIGLLHINGPYMRESRGGEIGWVLSVNNRKAGTSYHPKHGGARNGLITTDWFFINANRTLKQ